MKDELLMKPPVTAIDGSRFVSASSTSLSLAPENLVNTLSPSASAPTHSRSMPSRFAVALPEESMVIDDRSHLTPAQMVETKLMTRLKESSLQVSHIQMRGLVRKRYES